MGSRTRCRAAEDPRSYPIGTKSLVHSSSGVTWHRDQDHGRRLWHGACVDSQALTQRLGEARSIFATNYAYQPAQWFLARVGPARASQSTQLGNYRGHRVLAWEPHQGESPQVDPQAGRGMERTGRWGKPSRVWSRAPPLSQLIPRARQVVWAQHDLSTELCCMR